MKTLANEITEKRKALGITSKKLAELASVPQSLISGLQRGTRKIGEIQATRIGRALGLEGIYLMDFIYLAMNESSQRLLESSKAYPVEILNSLANILGNGGVPPEQIENVVVFNTHLEMSLRSGELFGISVNFNRY
jgi:transcriptional regulator with XRE-family HTH domain